MDSTDEHHEQFQSASGSETADPFSIIPSKISTSPNSFFRPKSPSSPNFHKSSDGTSMAGSQKNMRHSHSGRDGRPKKGGCGGKGTWGGLLDEFAFYPNDPNYSSTEENEPVNGKSKDAAFMEYKEKATAIVEEYFSTDDITTTANELRELAMPYYHFYFIKKLVSVAMDRHDKEKEMAAVLLSSLYADTIDPSQVHKGFIKLLMSADDLVVDIPDAVDVLALFIARAVVDDILPPSFLTKTLTSLPGDSKGLEVIKRAEKGYLSAPLHAETIERRWAGNKNKTAEDVKGRINNLLTEYISSDDKKEAYRCIKDLNVPFFHHEIVKRTIIMAMENQQSRRGLLDLLKVAAEEGLINSSQISKGFSRIIDIIDDLSLDIPNANRMLQALISEAASDGWLSASSLKPLPPGKKVIGDGVAKAFKLKAQSMIKEYFLSGDISEVSHCLECENNSSLAELNALFVKRLITLAMDRKNREKEMASVLLSSLCFPADDVVNGFMMLIESADDTALDNPVVVEDLAMFLARAQVDEVLAPQHLEEIGHQFLDTNAVGHKVIQMAKSLLRARLSGERILRCWGGGGGSGNVCAIEDVKDKIGKLLEEFESGGEIREACRCIKDLGMPFFHHEVVKKALVSIMEKKTNRLWNLLRHCFSTGLITMNQMMKGFVRVAESLDDLVLDVPDAREQFKHYVALAMDEGWLDSSFGSHRS